MALVAVTAAVVDGRNRHTIAAAAASRLAVDIRVDQEPGLPEPKPGTRSIRGDSSLDVKLHNLGPRAVHLTEVSYQFGRADVSRGTLLTTDVPVRPGMQLDRAFRVILPCGPTAQTAVPPAPVTLTAQVRTSDGRTHTVPVDLSALDRGGGVFVECEVYRRPQAYNADSELVPGGVRSSLDLPAVSQTGSNGIRVSLYRDGLPRQIGFVTSPRLPITLRPGTHLSVVIRPVVHGCPAGLDLTQLPALGLALEGDTIADSYLPLVVAEAVGRACAVPGR